MKPFNVRLFIGCVATALVLLGLANTILGSTRPELDLFVRSLGIVFIHLGAVINIALLLEMIVNDK